MVRFIYHSLYFCAELSWLHGWFYFSFGFSKVQSCSALQRSSHRQNKLEFVFEKCHMTLCPQGKKVKGTSLNSLKSDDKGFMENREPGEPHNAKIQVTLENGMVSGSNQQVWLPWCLPGWRKNEDFPDVQMCRWFRGRHMCWVPTYCV